MRHAWVGSLVAAAALAACKGGGEQPPPAPASARPTEAPAVVPAVAAPAAAPAAPVREGGALTRSATEDALYVADEDHAVVRKIRLPLDEKAPVIAIPMPGLPAQIVALADRVLVTIRSQGAPAPAAGPDGKAPPTTSPTGPGLLVILRPDPDKGLVEAHRVPLAQDAWGVAVTPDDATAIVTSAWTRKVSAVDLAAAKVRWTVDVPREPRAVVVRPDGRAAYVTHLVGSAVTRIDLGGEPKVRAVPLPPSPLRTPPGQRLGASLAYSAVLSPDGGRLFVPRHALGAVGPQAWFGAATVDVLLTEGDTPLAPPRAEGPRVIAEGARGMFDDLETGGPAPRVDPTPFVQPRAVVYRRKTKTLLVLGEGDHTMTELDARAIDPAMHVRGTHVLVQEHDRPIAVPKVCGAPTGITLSRDEQIAWIFCRSTYDLLEFRFDQDRGRRRVMRLAEDPLPAEAALGRRIFHDASDELTSGGLACAGCHPDGRDDGHVWHETSGVVGSHLTFVSGGDAVPSSDPALRGFPRQTPLLAGRLAAEGPYGWHAESPHLTHRLTEGFALHRWSDASSPHVRKDLHDRAVALRAFLRQGLVPPPREDRELTEKEKRGQEVFLGKDAGCATCHVPQSDYSDREKYALYAALPRPPGFAEDPEKKYKTPSLRFVGGTPPYMHDGRFDSLRALVEQNADGMGRTSHLGAADRDALVAFLETL